MTKKYIVLRQHDDGTMFIIDTIAKNGYPINYTIGYLISDNGKQKVKRVTLDKHEALSLANLDNTQRKDQVATVYRVIPLKKKQKKENVVLDIRVTEEAVKKIKKDWIESKNKLAWHLNNWPSNPNDSPSEWDEWLATKSHLERAEKELFKQYRDVSRVAITEK